MLSLITSAGAPPLAATEYVRRAHDARPDLLNGPSETSACRVVDAVVLQESERGPAGTVGDLPAVLVADQIGAALGYAPCACLASAAGSRSWQVRSSWRS